MQRYQRPLVRPGPANRAIHIYIYIYIYISRKTKSQRSRQAKPKRKARTKRDNIYIYIYTSLPLSLYIYAHTYAHAHTHTHIYIYIYRAGGWGRKRQHQHSNITRTFSPDGYLSLKCSDAPMARNRCTARVRWRARGHITLRGKGQEHACAEHGSTYTTRTQLTAGPVHSRDNGTCGAPRRQYHAHSFSRLPVRTRRMHTCRCAAWRWNGELWGLMI